ncbi:MAG: Major facilitator superfamily [Candidatus Gottesmanbacteria bacterium GW2011_GWB1_43_11]|uniref:Major facilitator superfamily n=1 Tax=Candidatus Gottesmanbacteria bacterium GW2011_GWB1_43_11 TaxID=1618446 RepID=A0A0G1CMF6_9BACT|nr:MAG: Major facilitator superfamily [Candidatus Gottesmanbacteria bacterium GW2011_GWA2_42_16]KKS54962.1 MAG: Major facilitator superfamily [Candidatus Gottesmanbacteria bacterium GW2011_GWA1_42_26]KKS80457.1 MAG: Major facilitator superfamily [Candidatus Gottesmanbacteria bacterium GW2011_GWC1_43_10]KKS86667.1 MAG: Major facilitator superfamily [Candidatus Gottesmanbacteria bacterium GW2011_GWB1_43_11]OGG10548.1 MAG: hypothetical protein A2699_06300 [Candidatus Gottesmanbacteria bacterium RI
MDTRKPDSTSLILQVLKVAPFRNLWLAQIISQIAFNMLTFVLAVLIYSQTRSNTAVSILYLTVGIPAAVFGIVSGVYVDLFNKRQTLIATTVIRAILLLGLFFLRSNLFIVYATIAAVSVVSQFFVPAEASLIPQFIDSKLLLSANSLFTLTFYSAIIGGFALGGPLLAYLGEANILILLTLLFLLSTGFLVFVPSTPTPIVVDKPKIKLAKAWQDLLAGLKFVRDVVPVGRAILLLTLAQAVIAIFITLGPGFVDRILRLELTDASLIILGPAALGMIVGALVVGSWGSKFRKRRLINFGLYVSGGLLIFLAVMVRLSRYNTFETVVENIFRTSLETGLLPISIGSFFLLGFANSLIDVSCNTVLQQQTTDEVRGKVYGILQSLIAGVAILPVVVSGLLADLFGVGKIIFLLGVFLLMFSFYTSGMFSRWREHYTINSS